MGGEKKTLWESKKSIIITILFTAAISGCVLLIKNIVGNNSSPQREHQTMERTADQDTGANDDIVKERTSEKSTTDSENISLDEGMRIFVECPGDSIDTIESWLAEKGFPYGDTYYSTGTLDVPFMGGKIWISEKGFITGTVPADDLEEMYVEVVLTLREITGESGSENVVGTGWSFLLEDRMITVEPIIEEQMIYINTMRS